MNNDRIEGKKFFIWDIDGDVEEEYELNFDVEKSFLGLILFLGRICICNISFVFC